MAIITNLTYSLRGNVVKESINEILDDVNITNILYNSDGFMTEIHYANGYKMIFTYDGNNNCTFSELKDDNNTVIEKWQYEYNSNGFLITATKLI